MQQFSLGGPEAERRARDELFGIQNARKAYGGMLVGLQDPATIDAKRTAEERLKEAWATKGEDDASPDPWRTLADLQDRKRELLRRSVSLRSELFDRALQIVLLAAEDQKPNADRLREFGDAGRESLLRELTSPAPIYRDLEQFKLADELSRMAELRGGDDELVTRLLGGVGPRQRAADLVAGTRIDDAEFRKALIDGGAGAVESSDDAMVRLARDVEEEYREVRKENEAVDEAERQAYADLQKIITAVEGTGGYPDATFTLRLAFGTVKGYDQDGERIEPTTDFAGAFEHADGHAGQKDFALPESWTSSKGTLDLSTTLNFVCTADIIGGNSGSPVVGRDGRLVGLIFDGNIQSLTSDYVYDDRQGRAVSVAGVGILEALRSIYGAETLAEELGR